MGDLKAQFEAFQRAIRESEDNVIRQVKAQKAEIEKNGETSAETARALKAAEDRLRSERESASADLEKKMVAFGDSVKAAEERLEELEKKGQRPGWDGPGGDAEMPGAQFTGSDFYKNRNPNEPIVSGVEIKGFREHAQRVAALGPAAAKATFDSTATERFVQPQRIQMLEPTLRTLRIRDLFPSFTTTSDAIEYVEEIGFGASGSTSPGDIAGAAAFVGEGEASPEAELQFALRTIAIREISHMLPVTKRILNDATQIEAYINGRLSYGVSHKEDNQLLYADGTGNSFLGVLTNPDRSTYAWSDGVVGDTKIDAIRRAIALAHQDEYMPTGIVLNPADWADIELQKGDDKHYIWMSVGDGAQKRMFQLPVVVTNAIAAGQSCVGSFGIGAAIWDREGVTISTSTQNRDWWEKGIVGLMASERLGLAVYRPSAFVDVAFDEAPTA